VVAVVGIGRDGMGKRVRYEFVLAERGIFEKVDVIKGFHTQFMGKRHEILKDDDEITLPLAITDHFFVIGAIFIFKGRSGSLTSEARSGDRHIHLTED
jgi:hypothetical protein